MYLAVIFCFILLTHEEGSRREVYRDFEPSLTSSVGGAKRCFCALLCTFFVILTLSDSDTYYWHAIEQGLVRPPQR